MGELKSERPTRKHVALLVDYLVVLVGAEFLLVLASATNDSTLSVLSLLIDAALVLFLSVWASLSASKDEALAAFLGALTLPPLLRVVSLATPFAPFTTIQWLAIVGIPLLLAAAAVMRALGLRPRDVFLGVGDHRYLPVNIALIVFGFGVGFLEYRILRPDPWIAAPSQGALALAIFAVFLTTGLAEELIFRGILLRVGIRFLGQRGALLYVTLVFSVFHIGFMSIPDFLLVLFSGLVFGVVVLLSKSLWGAIGAHTVANVALYLILPFGL